jgi:hypothetical protein
MTEHRIQPGNGRLEDGKIVASRKSYTGRRIMPAIRGIRMGDSEK